MYIYYKKVKIKMDVSTFELKRMASKRNNKFYGTVADPKSWRAIQQERRLFGKKIPGIDVGRLSEEKYQALIGEYSKKSLIL